MTSIVERLQTEIRERNRQLLAIQEQCNHPPAARKTEAGSNTGNYDPTADEYWYDHHCGLCGKFWRAPQ